MRKLTFSQKKSLKYLRAITYPCKICGNDKLRFDNNSGWTDVSIICNSCWQQKVTKPTIEEAIEEWNRINAG